MNPGAAVLSMTSFVVPVSVAVRAPATKVALLATLLNSPPEGPVTPEVSPTSVTVKLPLNGVPFNVPVPVPVPVKNIIDGRCHRATGKQYRDASCEKSYPKHFPSTLKSCVPARGEQPVPIL
jgi:hypothetical protein